MLERRDFGPVDGVRAVDIVEKGSGCARLTRLMDTAEVAEVVDLLERLRDRRRRFEEVPRRQPEIDQGREGIAEPD